MKRMSIPAGTVARLNSRLRFSFFGMDTIIYKEGIDEGGKGLSRGRREEIWFFAWAVSVVATLGSLYFSEIKGYEPCELCWYQRILMYPMTVLIGMAVARKDTRMSLYTAVLSGIGMCVSLYHYCLQKLAFFRTGFLHAAASPVRRNTSTGSALSPSPFWLSQHLS